VDDKATKTRAENIIKNIEGVESIENRIIVGPADRHA
jgi:osmotically-inducible protein OsmY